MGNLTKSRKHNHNFLLLPNFIPHNSTSWFQHPKPPVTPRGPQRESLRRRQSPAAPRRGQRLLLVPPLSPVTKPHPFSMRRETPSQMRTNLQPLERRWTRSRDWRPRWTSMVSPTVSQLVFSARWSRAEMSRLPPSPSFSTVVSCLPIPPWNLHTVADTVSLVRTVAESRLSLRLSISANTLSQTTSISTCSTRVHHQVNLVPSSGSSRKQRMGWRDSTSWPSRSWKTTDQNRLFSWIFTSVWKPWTPLPSPPVPRRFLLVSDSTRLPSRRRPRICLVDGVCEWLWPRLSSSSPLFFFSMTQQHIWIWKPACGWKNTSRNGTELSSLFLTPWISSTVSART